MKRIVWCTVMLALMFFWGTKNVQGSELNLSEHLSITGFQISTNVILRGENVGVGVRTVFEATSEIQGKHVERVGLIYGLVNDSNRHSELKLDAGRSDVQPIETPENGKISEREEDGVVIDCYAMIMPVYQGLEQAYYVRPYALLEDGSVVYGHSGTYSAFVIADYLYQRCLLPNEQVHREYYERVLQRARMDYEKVAYQPIDHPEPTVEPVYYESLEAALEDLKNETEENSLQNPEQAKLLLRHNENGVVLKLLADLELDTTVTIPEEMIVNLNDYTMWTDNGSTLSFEKDLTIKNGTMEFQDAVIAINDGSAERNRLTLRQVKIKHENTVEGKKTVTVNADNLTANKVTIHTNGMQNTQGVVVKGENSEINNSEINAKSMASNGFGIITAGSGTLKVTRVKGCVNAAQWSMGHYVSNQSKVQLWDCEILCSGKENNVPIYVESLAEASVFSGRYEGIPVPSKNGDSYGTGIFNLGTVTVSDGEIIGGNCGILCKEGSNTVITGGTFLSPNHGGVYCSCGSTGTCKINGGTFRCNRGDYEEEQLGDIVSFGAGYFGCQGSSEQWYVEIHDAAFSNPYGNGVVQKSNNNYIPATLNLYYCEIEAKNYAVWIQNNESVDQYDVMVNLFFCQPVKGSLCDDRYRVTGISRISLMY